MQIKNTTNRRSFLLSFAALILPGELIEQQLTHKSNNATKLVLAARTQIGTTLVYDPSYIRLSYPNGDVPADRGVCTDVIIRAYRKAFGFDLQRAVHEDMSQNFSLYPNMWGMKCTDRNIDHRRVPNLQTFLKRKGSSVTVNNKQDNYLPGDIITQMIGGSLPHIAIVSDKTTYGGRPLVIHNIGSGAKEEDYLFGSPITGHYRYIPTIST